jgi:hypothetical protein
MEWLNLEGIGDKNKNRKKLCLVETCYGWLRRHVPESSKGEQKLANFDQTGLFHVHGLHCNSSQF